MARPTRTIGPLHLEDLEPHRFEDLIRQLLYDFRPWRQLEATGRSGADQGFDARGWEIVPAEEEATLPSDEEEPPEIAVEIHSRTFSRVGFSPLRVRPIIASVAARKPISSAMLMVVPSIPGGGFARTDAPGNRTCQGWPERGSASV